MPRVRRVIWKADWDAPNWITSNTVKLLLEFHQLSELVLLADYGQDLGYIFKCLSKLHNLRKLSVEILNSFNWYSNRPNPLNDLGKVIGANLNLTHFELFLHEHTQVSCSAIFGHVPAGSPLKLEHLSISDNFSNVEAIVPHIRFLNSINFYARYNQILPVLHSERIFPPFIQASEIHNNLVDYLRGHPHIVSLSTNDDYNKATGTTILEIMAQHSESLKYFSTTSLGFRLCVIESFQNRLLLQQCTNLDQLTLVPRHHCDLLWNIAATLSIIARFPSSLTLVVSGLAQFKAFVKHCHQSQYPLIHDLARRIVYGGPARKWREGYCSEYTPNSNFRAEGAYEITSQSMTPIVVHLVSWPLDSLDSCDAPRLLSRSSRQLDAQNHWHQETTDDSLHLVQLVGSRRASAVSAAVKSEYLVLQKEHDGQEAPSPSYSRAFEFASAERCD
ncbi:hypothetical protein F5887DRAFT_1199358 [Amanita rubescens]|nr:hypothetical protein F5887DRAFT_1199358 [Amanita rubescens]